MDNIYERINKTLTWKRIVAFNLVLFLVLVLPIAARLSRQSTENRSGAAGEEMIVAEPTPAPNYPTSPPEIERVTTFYGKPGDTIILTGRNFGAYQWGSSAYIGNVRVSEEEVVRWSDSVLELMIPETARSGDVSVVINGKTAIWSGKLILSDATSGIKIALNPLNQNLLGIAVERASLMQRGTLELSYVSEPIEFEASPLINIETISQDADVLGKIVRVDFVVSGSLPRINSEIVRVRHPGIGAVELVRAEFYGASGNLLEVFSDPLSIKVLP